MHGRLKAIAKMDPTAYANILRLVQQIPDSVWLRSARMIFILFFGMPRGRAITREP